MTNRLRCFLILIACSGLWQCQRLPNVHDQLDIQGHRGCRGLLPENTVEGFVKALDIGVQTLEMDLVISADSQVVVSHEPFFSHEISRDPQGVDIEAETEADHNMFRQSAAEIRTYDVGLRPHRRFPDQVKIPAYKPTLSEVVTRAEAHAKATNRPLPDYNLEIKRRSEWDNTFHPDVRTYVRLVLEDVHRLAIADRTTIQSFDIEALQITKETYSNMRLVLLVENVQGIDRNIEKLGFTPEIYSPYFKLLIPRSVDKCHAMGMSLIPWTVNEENDIRRMIEWGVDGIISDYPDRVVEIYADLKQQKE